MSLESQPNHSSKFRFLALTFAVSAVAVLSMAMIGEGTNAVSSARVADAATTAPAQPDSVVPAEAQRADTQRALKPDDPRTSLYLPNIADIVDKVNGAVVNIRATEIIRGNSRKRMQEGPFDFLVPHPDLENDPDGDQRQDSGGTGFIVSTDGFIMTNYHVIEDADKVVVRIDGDSREYEADIIGTDELTDLALLKITAARALPTIPLGDSERVRVGEWVIAIGNPLVYDHTVTVGVVSAKGRKLAGLSRDVSLDNYIQTDAAINRGNSGGPLLNVRGEAVGINSAISVAGQGISFAIPINMARDVMKQLRERGEVHRGFLGVTIQDIQTELRSEEREYFRLQDRRGAFIQSVTAGQPADLAGLRPGDAVVSVDGKTIEGSDDLIRTISSKEPGSSVKLGLVRDGRETAVTAELTSRPTVARAGRGGPEAPEDDIAASEKRLGMTVEDLSTRSRRELNLPEEVEGVLVTQVSQVSDAWDRGLRRGDVITEVNRTAITSLEQYRDIVDSVKAGDILALYVRTPGVNSGRFVTLRVGDE